MTVDINASIYCIKLIPPLKSESQTNDLSVDNETLVSNSNFQIERISILKKSKREKHWLSVKSHVAFQRVAAVLEIAEIQSISNKQLMRFCQI